MKTVVFLLCGSVLLLFYCNTTLPEAASIGKSYQGRTTSEPDAKTPVEALMQGKQALALRMIQAGGDVNETNRFGDSALIWAANLGSLVLVETILDKGVEVNQKGSYGKAALHWAAGGGHLEVCELLLNRGARVNRVDEDLETPLFYAARGDHVGVVQLLLERGASLDWKSAERETALMSGLRKNAGRAVEALVLKGADPTREVEGKKPLQLALTLGNSELLMTERILALYPDLPTQLKEAYQPVVLNETERPNLDLAVLAEMIHERVNAERAKNGLRVLAYDAHLARIALGHSRDMSKRGFFDHTNPDKESPRDRAEKAGYQTVKNFGSSYKSGIGENIYRSKVYKGSAASYQGAQKLVTVQWHSMEDLADNAVRGWMESPGHRANILNTLYEGEGLGIYISENSDFFVTQNFF